MNTQHKKITFFVLFIYLIHLCSSIKVSSYSSNLAHFQSFLFPQNDFNDFKYSQKYRYINFKLNSTVSEKKGAPTETWSNFVDSLPANECRYSFVSFQTTSRKLLLINWSPNTAKVTQKMQYVNSLQELNKKVTGIFDISCIFQGLIKIRIDKIKALKTIDFKNQHKLNLAIQNLPQIIFYCPQYSKIMNLLQINIHQQQYISINY